MRTPAPSPSSGSAPLTAWDVLSGIVWTLAVLLLVGAVLGMIFRDHLPWRTAAAPPPAVAPAAPTSATAASPSQAAASATNTVVDPFSTTATTTRPIICLDPGHPSETNPGDTPQHGLREVEITYDVALLLKSTLEEEMGATVILTRDFRGYDHARKRIVSNRRRAEIANAAGADLLLRLHCDTGKGRGFTVYYPDRQTTLNGHTGPSAAVRRMSEQCADALRGGLAEVLDGTLRDNGVRGESATYIGRRQQALTGSVYSDVPVVLVEMVVLSDVDDARFIGSKDGQQQMADGLAIGVGRCFSPGLLSP